MKKNILALFILILAFSFCGCGNKKKVLENPFETNDKEEILYSFGFGYKVKNVEDGTFDVAYTVDNAGTRAEFGMIVFVNGIPQQCNYLGEYNYMPTITIDEESNEYFTIVYNALSHEKNTRGVVRAVRILEPEVFTLDTNDKQNAFYHSISGNYAKPQFATNKYDETIDIGYIDSQLVQAELAKTTCVELLINGEKTNCVRNDKSEYTLKLSSAYNEKYVLSFWGNNEPIKIGEHIFYEIDMKAGEVRNIKLDIPFEGFEELNTLQIIMCPVSENTSLGVEATQTVNFTHINDEINESNTSTETETSSEKVDDETLFKTMDFADTDKLYRGHCLAILGYDKEQKIVVYDYENKEIINEIRTKDIPYLNVDFVEGFGSIFLGDSAKEIKCKGEGIFVSDSSNIALYNSKLELIYQGNSKGFFKEYEVDSIEYITEDLVIGMKQTDQNMVYIIVKETKSGKETELCNSKELGIVPENVYNLDNFYVIQGADINNKNKFVACIYNADTKEISKLDGKSFLCFSPDGNIVLFNEYVSGWNEDKPYVFKYNFVNNSINKIDLIPGEFGMQNLNMSNDGNLIISYVDRSFIIYDDNGKFVKLPKENKFVSYYFPTQEGLLVQYNGEEEKYVKMYMWSDIFNELTNREN